jgi:hypothetical protein
MKAFGQHRLSEVRLSLQKRMPRALTVLDERDDGYLSPA